MFARIPGVAVLFVTLTFLAPNWAQAETVATTGTTTLTAVDTMKLSGTATASRSGVAYFEYGERPSELRHQTDQIEFNPGTTRVSAPARFLRPGRSVWYRLVIDLPQVKPTFGEVESALVPHPTEFPGRDPCPFTGIGETHRISRDVVITCTETLKFAGHSTTPQRMVCPREFPRNLLSSEINFQLNIIAVNQFGAIFNIPIKINTTFPFSWASTSSVRIDKLLLWRHRSSQGSEDPLRQGWQKFIPHNWSGEYAEARFWIYCTNNWGAPSKEDVA